jgi:hypothetical protein
MKILELTGNADDLLCIYNGGQMKSVSAVKLCDDECCDLEITLTSYASEDNPCIHNTIDQLLGHKIKFSVETID